MVGILVLVAVAAQAQLVNGDFEAMKAVTAPPATVWTLKTNLLPESWTYNSQYGGPVGLVEDAHSGKYALSFAAKESFAHVIQAMIPVKTGEVLELSGWGKNGNLDLTFYEYTADQKWLRTTPTVARIEAGPQWQAGGGYFTVSDPAVAFVTVVLGTDTDGVIADDIAMRKVEVKPVAEDDIVLDNQNCRLVLAANGSCRSFYDKTLKEERLSGQPRPFMSAQVEGWNLPLTGLKHEGGNLLATFGENKAQATIECQVKPYWIGLILKSSQPKLTGIALVDVNLKKLATNGDVLGANYDDKTAVAVQALQCSGLGQLRSQPQAVINLFCSYGKFGTDKAGCALITCPRPRLELTLQEMETAYGIPSPRINGAWPKGSPLMRRSYFFVTDLSEANVDEVIRYAKRGHFGYLLVVEDAWSHGGGTFAINEKNFPHGLDGLKATVAKLHAAGLRVGLHVLSAGMRGTDPLVSPVPDNGIYVDVEVPLAADIDEQATFIPTATPPSKLFDLDNSYEGHGTQLRVGDEIISYGGLKLDAPYGFTNCRRGYLGSKVTAHKANDLARHLYMSYGLYLIDANTDLLDRVSANVARVVNYCNTDGFYWDGCERLQGDHNYYNAKIQDAYYSKFTRRDMTLQGSSFSHFSWHWICREASADGFAQIKEYLDKRIPSFEWYFNNLMPLDVGWYAVNSNNRPDSIEYICSKATGFSSSISIETGLANLNSVPQAPEVIDMIARWEDLRLSGRVTEAIAAKLREPGKEYHLNRVANQDLIESAEYSAFVQATDDSGQPAVLQMENKRQAPARVQLELECGSTIRPGGEYETGQPLELFEGTPPGGQSLAMGNGNYNPATDGNRATSTGVTQELTLVTDDVKEGKSALRFGATSTLSGPGGWATFGKAFPQPIALKDYGIIGLWVKGDGKGELLKVQLWDTKGNPQDQYTTINFTGWRFLELERPKPDVIDTQHVRSINFYYNGMPGNTTCSILIDGVKVMARKATMTNPAVQINGTRVLFPVTFGVGDRLLYEGGPTCTVYPVGQEGRQVKVQGGMPKLPQKLEGRAEEASHQMQMRAGMFWPTLALKVPAK